MIAIAVSDARRFLVPDVLSLPAIPAGLLASVHVSASEPLVVVAHIVGMTLGAASFYGIRQAYVWSRGRQGLGMGDVKLAAVAGAWTGVEGLVLVVLVASLSALAWVAIVILIQTRRQNGAERRLDFQSAVPFGAFLAPAIWIVYVL